MLEKQIENYLVKECRKAGIITYKCTGCAGIPDRMLICRGTVLFVELKTPTGRLSKLQEHEIGRIQGEQIDVFVTDSKAGVDTILRYLKEQGEPKA